MANASHRGKRTPRTQHNARGKKARAQTQSETSHQPTLHLVPTDPSMGHVVPFLKKKKPFEALTKRQALYANAIKTKPLTFGIGYAGTGKTHIAAEMAYELYEAKLIERIVVMRPAVEAGEKFGFLPGDMDEKIDPWFAVLKDKFNFFFGSGFTEYLIKKEKIIFAPIGFLRGHTLDDALVIIDESQNTTPEQMELALSRAGNRTKYVVCGDDRRQCDLKPNQKSGLTDALSRFSESEFVSIIDFGVDDIVRSPFCKAVILAYSK